MEAGVNNRRLFHVGAAVALQARLGADSTPHPPLLGGEGREAGSVKHARTLIYVTDEMRQADADRRSRRANQEDSPSAVGGLISLVANK